MTRNPDVLCAGGCGRMLWRTTRGGAPLTGERRCRACARAYWQDRSSITCTRCGESKPRDQFGSDGRQPCKQCNVVRTLEWRARTGYKSRRYYEERACIDCGAVIRVRKDKPARWCSPCAHRRSATSLAARTAAASRRLPRRIRTTVFVGGTCLRCSRPFVVKLWADPGSSPRYCSDRCRNWRKGKGRSRPEITQTQRLAVFERDRWVCRLCGKRVSRTLRWPHDRCAVVDHIVPLSAGPENGGVHAMHNWQTAHNECNRRKSNHYAQAALL